MKINEIIGKKSGDILMPLQVHCEDTANTMVFLAASCLYESQKKIMCLQPDEFYKVCYLLGYLHDIGKATVSFQEKIRGIVPGFDVPHARASQVILSYYYFPEWFASVVGSHHGKPQDNTFDWQTEYAKNKNNYKYMDQCIELIQNALNNCGIELSKTIDIKTQMILSGLLIEADWIASDAEFFPITSDCGENEERLENAKKKLQFLIKEPKFEPKTFLSRFKFKPNRIQESVEDIAKTIEKPGIVILEAQMGCGKTEAALCIAEAFQASLKCGGLLFALPTQATANGLFDRVAKWSEDTGTGKTIGLVHGASKNNADYLRFLENSESLSTDKWLDRHKRKLFADIVVGTIDQLLVAGTQQKHAMLLHLALSGKVVIIDECHAYDAYMSVFLESVLSWLGLYGIPVIILSATLPYEKRLSLLEAYTGKSVDGVKFETNKYSYPLLTWTDGNEILQETIEHDGKKVKIEVGFVDGIDSCLNYLDGCVGIIVNTVKRATEIYNYLVGICSKDTNIILYHSRFTSFDRNKKEEDVMRYAGKQNKDKCRKTIIIGTQVLEQSLDIDFDVLYTDICPMDLFLQRCGRLHRHLRERPAGLENPKVFVMNMYLVYDKYLIDRTKKMLPSKITLPDDIPLLVQNVYDFFQEGTDNSYLFKIREKIAKAEVFALKSPYLKSGKLRKRISNLFDDDSVLSDVQANSMVRDSLPPIEVYAFIKDEDGNIRYFPWINNGKLLSDDCDNIGKQLLKLPVMFSSDKTIQELNCDILHNKYVLLFDSELKCVFDGYRLTYSNKGGLIHEKI